MKRVFLTCSSVALAVTVAACDTTYSTAPDQAFSISSARGLYGSCDPAAVTPGPAANSSVTSLLGDKDGFGLGLTEGSTRDMSSFDTRTASDPSFTDWWSTPRDFTYQHTFTPPARGIMIRSAALELFTLGVQDGDNQVLGSDTDERLYVDGIEVANAFDDVDQFTYSGGWVHQAGKVTLRLPPCVLPLLYDGAASVRIEILQLGTAPGYDAFSVDYSELKIEEFVPPGLLK